MPWRTAWDTVWQQFLVSSGRGTPSAKLSSSLGLLHDREQTFWHSRPRRRGVSWQTKPGRGAASWQAKPGRGVVGPRLSCRTLLNGSLTSSIHTERHKAVPTSKFSRRLTSFAIGKSETATSSVSVGSRGWTCIQVTFSIIHRLTSGPLSESQVPFMMALLCATVCLRNSLAIEQLRSASSVDPAFPPGEVPDRQPWRSSRPKEEPGRQP